MKNEENKGFFNNFKKALAKRKSVTIKITFAVFCVAILIISGISAALDSFDMKKENVFQSDIAQEVEGGINTLYHPDITQYRDENFIGNTGKKLWHFYIEGLINSANGNLYILANDISIKALGFDIEIIRSYNSLNSNYSTGFGYGWTFNYNTYLIDKDSYVLWVEGDGSVHNFTYNGNGNYTSPPGIYSRLNKNVDDTYGLWFKEGEKYTFDLGGLLQEITDKNDNHLTFFYLGRQLIRISDDSGMQLNISYNERNKISSIEDPLGRKINYVYDIYDNLIRVDDAMGYSTRYLYSCCHKLSSYVDKENVALSFSYFEDSKKVDDVRASVYDAASQFHYNGFMLLFIVYDEVNDTTYYLNAENYASALIMNEEGNPIEYIDSLNSSIFLEWTNNSLDESIDENGNVFQYEYDNYGNLIKVIDPLGYELCYDWSNIDTSDTYLSQLKNISKVEYEPTGSTYDIFKDTFDPVPQPGWINTPAWLPLYIDPHTPPISWLCGFGGYGEGWHETLQSPFFNFSGYTNVELTFWHKGDFDGSYPYMFDGGNVKISTDGGQTWTLIHPEGGYDGKLKWGNSNPMEVEMAFGYTFPWTQERFDLTPYVGRASNISIRFEMGTDTIMSPGYQGWNIDDFLITGYNISERKITTQVSFDGKGNIIEINDYMGNSSFFDYDQNGNMLNLTDFGGYKTRFVYDDHGYLRNITDVLGNSTGYNYDLVGGLINVTDINGHKTSHIYNDNDLLIRTIDPTGNQSKLEYNKNGALISVIDENGHQTNFTVSVVGRIQEVEDPAGNVTHYKTTRTGEPTRTTDANDNTADTGYDPLGRPVSETDPYGNTDWWGYDAIGNVIWMMDKNNGITNYEYDKMNRLTRTIYPDLSLVVNKYNEFGDLIDVTDQNGHHTIYEYDDLGRQIRAIGLYELGIEEKRLEYDANSNIVNQTDGNNHSTYYEYNQLNRLIKITDPLGNFTSYDYDAIGNLKSFTDKKGNITSYDYDPLNRLIEITNPFGDSTSIAYDAVGNIISTTNNRGFTTEIFYDKLNRVIQEKDPMGNSTYYEYDALGNLISVRNPNNNQMNLSYDALNRLETITDALGYQTTYGYDIVGNLNSITDENGNIMMFWHDSLNRVITSGNPIEADYLWFTYDKKGNLLSVEDANQNTMYFAYDDLDRPTSTTTPSGMMESYSYDGNGNIIQRIDANGNITDYVYDPLDRLVKIDYPIGNVTFTFDANDNMLNTSNNGIGLGDTTTMTYDELNRIKSVNIDYGVFDKTIQYTYDEMGNILTMTNPEDGVTSYDYDPLDRLQQVTDPSNDITRFYYDNGSRVQNIIYPNDAYANYTYDKTDCLLQVVHSKSDHSIISSYDYGYDGVGNRINMTDHLSQLTTYVYDKINRLINVTYHAVSTNVQYTYDGIGNRLTKTINYSQITNYNYDTDNKLLTDGTNTYNYDYNGNLISKTDGINITRYSYDFENRLTNIILPNASTIDYNYAIFDDRLQKTVGGTSTYFLYDFYDVLGEYDQSGNPTAEYTHGHVSGRDFDEPISITRGENKGYYHVDGLGSIIALTDEDENVVNAYSYSAFGEIVQEQESIKNTHKFNAKEFDKELDLYFYRCRYYDPGIGRFITKDPFGTIDGINLYIYVRNNPINFIDPCGRKRGSAKIGPWYREWDTETNYGAECEDALEKLLKELQGIEDRYDDDKRAITRISNQRNDRWFDFFKALGKSIPIANTAIKVHIAAGETLKQIPATEPLFTVSNFLLFAKELGKQFGIGPDLVKDIIKGEILKALGSLGKLIGKITGLLDVIEGLASLADKTDALVDNYTDVSHGTENAKESRTTSRNNALRKFKDLVDTLLNTKKVKSTGKNADSETVHIDPDGKPDPDSPPGPAGSGYRTPGTQVTGGHQPGPQPPRPGPKGPNQGGAVVTGPKPLEPQSQPTLPVPRTDPPWINRIPGYEYPPYGNGVGFGAGGGGDLGLPAPDEYCEYRIVYFGSRIVDDLGENRKVLHNAIKWAARHPTTLWNTTVLLMPSWGGYEGWDDYWEEFALEYPDIILLRWSDLQNQRALVTYSELKMIDADVLIDSDHYSSTQQGGYYTLNEMEAIQKYLLDEHGYIATYGTVGDNPGQGNQTARLLTLLGLEEKDGNPHKYTNSNPWILDQPWHPIFYNVSMTNWPNAGDVTGNVDIGVCPLCGEEHLGSKLAHLESTDGNHHSLISAYVLWYAPLSTGGLISQSGGECIVVPQTVYFGNRVVNDTGNNHLALYNSIKWAAEKSIGEETNVLIMPGWGGYDGWSLWQSFADDFPDINLSRWSDSSTSRNPVTTYGLEATEADVLIDSNHSSVTQQGGFYTFGELQAIEWYVKDRGHGYVVTFGSLGNHTQQMNQTEKLMELLGINKTTTIGNYQNDRDWIIDQPYHPIIYTLSTWNPGNVTANLDVEEAEKIAHLYSTQDNHHTIISAYEGFGQGTCACECNIPPVSNFTWSPQSPTTGDLIQFTDLSEDIDGAIVNWTWDFDDDNTSYLQNPTHQYTNGGTYNVILTVKDDGGEPASIAKPVVVTSGGPVVNIDTGEQFSTIQSAIDDSDTLDGHTIFVGNGTYYEHVVINKRITLTGEDKNITTIDGDNAGTVITIISDYVNITDLAIINGGDGNNSVYVMNSDYINIYNTILTGSENGILLDSSHYNTITDNNASHNNDDGVEIWHNSQYNTIQNNTFVNNGAGVFIYDSTNNTINNNVITDSTAFGIQLYDGANYNIISNNIINRTTDVLYPDISGDAICLFYYNSDHIFNCKIENNKMYDNIRGITLRQSHENIIRNNTIENSSKIGVEILQSSANNIIYHNNFIDNFENANSSFSNTWDNGYPSGGNYWSDYDEPIEGAFDFYHGPNQDILGADNIADDEYSIPGGSNQDNYPLMHPWGVEGFYLNLDKFPMYEAESDPGYNEMCGPAVAQMTLNYIWWNSSNHSTPPMLFDNQTWLYERGRENNTNQTLPYLDTRGLWYIIQYNKPMPYSTFGYNFMKYSNVELDEMLKRICLWINYTIGSVGGYKPGHPLHVPAVVPAYGDYTNWMAIRGFHANRTAHPMPDKIMVYGFWVNDPYPASLGGLGENSYKTLSTWVNNYYQPLETDDIYDGKYVAIFEPPEITNEVDLTIATSPPRFTLEQQQAIQRVQLGKEEVPQDLLSRLNQWIIQAAIEGVAEQLIPYDEDFAAAFAKTTPGIPIFVKSLSGDSYYAVPFNMALKTKKTIPGIEKSIHKKDTTIIVILIDANDGSFKEASWVKNPVKYLPLSESDVQKMLPEILEEMGIEIEDPSIVKVDLIYRDSTPYYPDWRITIEELGIEFFISQDGSVHL